MVYNEMQDAEKRLAEMSKCCVKAVYKECKK